MAAQRARRAGDQLAAPAARPRVDGLHQLGARPSASAGQIDALDQLAGAPPVRAAGRRLDAHAARRLPSSALIGPVIQFSSPLRAATISREGRTSFGSGTAGWPLLDLVDRGLRVRRDAERAARGQRRETCWPRLGAGCLRPVTLPSQVTTCSCSESSGSARGEQPGGGQPRGEARGERGERGRGERRQRGHVDGDARRVEHRARHLQALQALGREPVRDDRDHAAAGLDPRGQRVHQQPGLFGRRRLGDGVDPAFRADQPLGLEPEGDDHRRGARWFRGRRKVGGMALPPERAHGHNRGHGRNKKHVNAAPAGSMWRDEMEVVVLLVALVGIALVVIPRLQRRRAGGRRPSAAKPRKSAAGAAGAVPACPPPRRG